MGTSSIIYGGNSKSRLEFIASEVGIKVDKLENDPDILILDKGDKASIGISQIRDVTRFLMQKPFAKKFKLVICNDAGDMTVPAQNAFLKTLEEPPIYAKIFLSCENSNNLLPTVTSRCKTFMVKPDESNPQQSGEFPKLLNKNIAERLNYVEQLAKEEKEEILQELKNTLNYIHENISVIDFKHKMPNSELLFKVYRDIETTNVSVKLALEYLALNL